MNYKEKIDEPIEKLQTKAKKQKQTCYRKRFHFLILLKSGKARTQKEAGEMVGWKLRYSQKIWQIYQEKGLSGLEEKPYQNKFWNFNLREFA